MSGKILKLNWNTPQLLSADHPLLPWIILGNITFATLLGILSSVSTLIADPTIQGALIINSTQGQWISTGYLMMLGVGLPLSPWLAERNGYKLQYTLALGLFLAGSILTGVAPNFTVLMIGRIVEGAGAGMLFPISLSIIAKTFPEKKLPMAMSVYTSIGFGLGIVCGFMLGGYASEYLSWRSIFLINMVAGIPAILATLFFHSETPKHQLPTFDYWGYAAFILFLVDALMVVSNAKAPWNTEGWTSHFIITCASLSAIGFIALMIIESKHPNPLIPLVVFKSIPFAIGCLAMVFVGNLFFGSLTMVANFMLTIMHYDRFLAGKTLALFGVTLTVLGLIMGYASRKINPRILVICGIAVIGTSAFIYRNITLYSPRSHLILALMTSALGVSLTLAPLTTLSLMNVPKPLVAAGAGLITFCRQMGAAFGGSLMGLFMYQRQIFHAARFAEQIRFEDPAHQIMTARIIQRSAHLLSKPMDEAVRLSKVVVAEDVIRQARSAALDDLFTLLSYVSIIFFIMFLTMIIHDFVVKKIHHEP